MNSNRTCLKCGTPLPQDAPEGICPHCLFQVATGASSTGESRASTSTTILSAAGDLHSSPGPGSQSEVLPAICYFGDYELQDEIARGGMGVVYRARQTTLNRIVAVKMILAGQLASPEAVRRFRAEAQAAANLQHPNIVAIHEVGEHEGQHYFSMDYVEGRNLSQVLGGKPVAPRRAAELVETMASAIHFGHQRGTLHRDLKPQNILIDSSGQPRITDFGLAKRIDEDQDLTQSGTVMGSPSYMPPEQAAGRQDQIGPQSDVYSLGAILYELLTGQPPFRAETAMATLIKVRDEQPIKPTRLNIEVPRDLETICLKCLEKQPDRRYSSARALGEDLRRFLNDEPVLARPISLVRRIEFWALHHPWVLMLTATVGLMFLLGVTYYLWEQNSFLVWKSAHPEYVRAPGPRAAEVRKFKEFLMPVFTAVVLLSLVYRFKSGQLQRAAEIRAGNMRQYKVHPVGPALRQTCYAVGTLGIVLSLYVLIKAIQKSVWEDPMGALGLYLTSDVYLAAAFCSFIASVTWGVCRDQHAVQTGQQQTKEKVETPLNHREVLSRLIAVGAFGFFALYFSNVWLPEYHFPGKHMAVQFLAGFTLGAAISFSIAMRSWWRRVALVLSASIFTTIAHEVYSELGRRTDYLVLYTATLAFGLALTHKLLQRRTS